MSLGAKFLIAGLSAWVLGLTVAVAGLGLTLALEPTPAGPTSGVNPNPNAPPAAEPRPVAPRGDLAAAEETTIDIFRQAAPSVVFITKLAVRRDPFRRNITTIPQGTGSGFIWDNQGHVVTNYHVVRGADAARVTLSDQSVWAARLVGHYADKDIAVLRIEAPQNLLPPLPVGTSSDLLVGQHVYAIGNPFGLDHTLSTGVVSGLGREIPSIGGRPITGAIQTDAAINPGNSGGPLLDSAGRLIGVNTQIYSPSGASAGVGFAVPVDSVARVVPQLIQHGRIIRPALGVQIDEGGLARQAGVTGVLVLGIVPNSPAAAAGLQPARQDRSGRIVLGDIIVAIDDEPIAVPTDLFDILDRRQVGQPVRVKLRRDGQEREISLTLMPVNAN